MGVVKYPLVLPPPSKTWLKVPPMVSLWVTLYNSYMLTFSIFLLYWGINSLNLFTNCLNRNYYE